MESHTALAKKAAKKESGKGEDLMAIDFLTEDFLGLFDSYVEKHSSLSSIKEEVAEKTRGILQMYDMSDVQPLCEALTKLASLPQSKGLRPLIEKLCFIFSGGLVHHGIGAYYAPEKAAIERRIGKRETFYISRFENLSSEEKKRILSISLELEDTPTKAILGLKERPKQKFLYDFKTEELLIRILKTKSIEPGTKLGNVLFSLSEDSKVLSLID